MSKSFVFFIKTERDLERSVRSARARRRLSAWSVAALRSAPCPVCLRVCNDLTTAGYESGTLSPIQRPRQWSARLFFFPPCFFLYPSLPPSAPFFSPRRQCVPRTLCPSSSSLPRSLVGKRKDRRDRDLLHCSSAMFRYALLPSFSSPSSPLPRDIHRFVSRRRRRAPVSTAPVNFLIRSNRLLFDAFGID